MNQSAQSYLDQLREILAEVDASAIDALTDLVFQTWLGDRQVIVFGNGGSAYTASHFVTDLVKTAAAEGQRHLRTISLLDNMGLVTAVSNDIGYDQFLCYQLESYGRPGDLAIAISGSGISPNIVNACRWATENGLSLIAVTGFDGGKIAAMSDLHFNVPSDNYGLIEDIHLAVVHMVSQALKERIAVDYLSARFKKKHVEPSGWEGESKGPTTLPTKRPPGAVAEG
ncbi:MAG: SIS domain-containing protein [bacterium]|nr:SIS domain-containing protein [bacterium]